MHDSDGSIVMVDFHRQVDCDKHGHENRVSSVIIMACPKVFYDCECGWHACIFRHFFII
ncbi:MAG: hypothetical protein WCN27_05610 [Alphaproteobacteria bacterium]